MVSVVLGQRRLWAHRGPDTAARSVPPVRAPLQGDGKRAWRNGGRAHRRGDVLGEGQGFPANGSGLGAKKLKMLLRCMDKLASTEHCKCKNTGKA